MLTPEGFKPEIKTKIINLCKAIIPDASIGIYGSRARGDYSERSDLDIVLEGSKPINYFDIAELKDVLNAANLPCSIDIVDINTVQDQDFKTNILKERIIWQK
jgi:predicted nucleotidyltransferase